MLDCFVCTVIMERGQIMCKKRNREKKWRMRQDWASNMDPTPGPRPSLRTSWLSVLREGFSYVCPFPTTVRPSPSSPLPSSPSPLSPSLFSLRNLSEIFATRERINNRK